MDYLEIGIGIAVSVILFLVGYRQTIGAKKVRAESAFNEIGQILLRNLVDRNYVLTISEINRIIQAKCIEKKIKINDLPDEITFINVLFTRIAEDEILSCDKKNEYMQLITNYLKQEEEMDSPSVYEETTPEVNRERLSKFLLAFISIVIATSILPIFMSFGTGVIMPADLLVFSMTIIGMIITLGITTILIRFKEEREELVSSRTKFAEEWKNYENRIFKIIKGMGEVTQEFPITIDDKIVIFDFFVKHSEKNFLIELKMGRNYPSKLIINRIMAQGKIAKKIDKNYITILVVNNKKYLTPYFKDLLGVWDYIFDEYDLKNFRNKLSHD